MEKVKYTAKEIMNEELIQLPEPDWTGTLKDSRVASAKNPLCGKGGLYIIKLGDDVAYVGVSVNLQIRLAEHYNKKSKSSTLISHLSDDYGGEKAKEIRDVLKVKAFLIENALHADFLEAYLINNYRPEYNMNSKGKCRAGGYGNRTKDPLGKHKEEIIYKYSEKELSMSAIGRDYGCSNDTIRKRLSEWGVTVRERKARKNVSIEVKKRAVYEYRYGEMLQREVGEKYGVTQRAISLWNKKFSDAEINELEDATAH